MRTPVRRRSSNASTALATRACSGQTAPGPARRAPSTRSAVPAATGSTTRESSRGSNDASQSMKQTMSARGGAQAGEAGRAEARLRLVHDARAERRGELARAVGRAVVDDDRVVAGGHALEHPGQGVALVEHGQDDFGHRRGSRLPSLGTAVRSRQ